MWIVMCSQVSSCTNVTSKCIILIFILWSHRSLFPCPLTYTWNPCKHLWVKCFLCLHILQEGLCVCNIVLEFLINISSILCTIVGRCLTTKVHIKYGVCALWALVCCAFYIALECYSWLLVVSVNGNTASIAHNVCGFMLAVARRWMISNSCKT